MSRSGTESPSTSGRETAGDSISPGVADHSVFPEQTDYNCFQLSLWSKIAITFQSFKDPIPQNILWIEGLYGFVMKPPEVPLMAVRCEEPTSRHTGSDWRGGLWACGPQWAPSTGCAAAPDNAGPVCSPHCTDITGSLSGRLHNIVPLVADRATTLYSERRIEEEEERSTVRMTEEEGGCKIKRNSEWR